MSSNSRLCCLCLCWNSRIITSALPALDFARLDESFVAGIFSSIRAFWRYKKVNIWVAESFFETYRVAPNIRGVNEFKRKTPETWKESMRHASCTYGAWGWQTSSLIVWWIVIRESTIRSVKADAKISKGEFHVSVINLTAVKLFSRVWDM